MKKKIKKIKECTCGAIVGAKTRTCPKCQHKFIFQKKIIGGKNCPQCTILLKKRAKECGGCGYKYPEKKKNGYEEIKEWTKLKKGQQVILRKGSRGPYFQGETQKILMGYRGTYIVSRVQKDGILAYSTCGGFAFLYMGPKKYCEISGLHKRSYKLFKKI